MIKKAILGWNAAPGAPPSWDPKQDGDCGALPIRVVPPAALEQGRAHLLQYVESAWEPTPQELEWLNAGGQVVLRIAGWQVPVAIYCEPPRDDA